MGKIICRSKSVALSVLEAVAETFPKGGTQRESLLAVKSWLDENASAGYIAGETKELLNRIFEGDGHDRLAGEWLKRNRKGEPAHGARVFCLWNGKTKKWEPEFKPGGRDSKTDE